MSELKEIRLVQLKKLVDEYRSQENLAAAINKNISADEKPISPTQISNALGKRRMFGDKICRKIERALNLSMYWLEGDNEIATSHPLLHNSPDISSQKLYMTFILLIRIHGENVLKLPLDQLSELLAEEYNRLPDKVS